MPDKVKGKKTTVYFVSVLKTSRFNLKQTKKLSPVNILRILNTYVHNSEKNAIFSLFLAVTVQSSIF